MKRKLAVLLALAMLIGCVALFASCGAKPELDLEKAKDALEDEDYTVYYSDDEDDLPVYAEGVLSASDDDDNYVYIMRFADAKTAKLYYNTLKIDRDNEIAEIKAEIKSLKAEIKASEQVLKKYEDDMKSDEIEDLEDEIEELEDEIKDLEKELEDMKEDYVIGRSGKVVWYGTADAIKDSKG